MKPRTPLHHLIQLATGAAKADLELIENIMREDIFHSTLDWQTREQLIAGAQQAQQRLEADRDWLVLAWQCRKKILQQMQASPNTATH